MVKDTKPGDFGNYDFSRKNQNFEWKTTLKRGNRDCLKIQYNGLQGMGSSMQVQLNGNFVPGCISTFSVI